MHYETAVTLLCFTNIKDKYCKNVEVPSLKVVTFHSLLRITVIRVMVNSRRMFQDIEDMYMYMIEVETLCITVQSTKERVWN